MECNIEVEEYSVESVEEVVYLGIKFSADGRMEGELNRRIAIHSMSAVGAFQKKVFGSGELSKKAKVEVYNAIVVPMMSYGCESWLLRKRKKTRLQASKISALRKIGVTRLEYIRNEEHRHRLQQRSVVKVVKERREKWLAKVMEKIGSLVEKMRGEVKGRRPRGTPRKRWRDEF